MAKIVSSLWLWIEDDGGNKILRIFKNPDISGIVGKLKVVGYAFYEQRDNGGRDYFPPMLNPIFHLPRLALPNNSSGL